MAELDTDAVDCKNRDAEQSQAETFDEVLAGAQFFHTPEDEPFADITVSGHRETHAIWSSRFKTWLRREYKAKRGRAPHPPAIDQAREEAASLALDDGPERTISIRTAFGEDGAIYIDLGDAEWRAIRVGPDGWDVVSNPPARFRRSKSMRALPVPDRDGSLDGLWSILNLAAEPQRVLVFSYMVAALHPSGPYPHLTFRGAQGTAKTTSASTIESMVDPGLEYPRAMPKSLRDAAIAARNSHVLSFDNVSKIDPNLSDFLCRLSTGASSAIRALYSDADEVFFQSRNPVILNGITEVVNRPDLSERCIFLELEPIPPSQRRLEAEVRAEADRVRPAVLGALLDAMVHGLRTLPSVHLAELPRMADFARWATACEGRWFEVGSFVKAYTENQSVAVDAAIEASPFMKALRELMDARYAAADDYWQGSCGQLFRELNEFKGLSDARKVPLGWPESESGVSRGLDRATGPFAKVGLTITRGRRLVTIQRVGQVPTGGRSFRESVASVTSVDEDEISEVNGTRTAAEHDASDARDASSGTSNSHDTYTDGPGEFDLFFDEGGF